VILYLDTSSLVKLYVEETASADVEGLVGSAEVTGTSLIGYAEAKAAFARRFRENAFSSKDYDQLRSQFESDWKNFLSIHVNPEIVRIAGDLAEKHGLRGFDAVHLGTTDLIPSHFHRYKTIPRTPVKQYHIIPT